VAVILFLESAVSLIVVVGPEAPASFPIKTAIFVRSVVITGVLVSAGYVADMAPTPELISGIKNGIALIPALFIGAGLIIILALYRITPETQKQMQKEIAARS